MARASGNIFFRIKEGSWLARIAAWKLGAQSVAIVFGHTVHLSKADRAYFLSNEDWVKHELCHVRQFQHYGFFNFIVRYLWESVLNGYYNNKYEVEARAAEKQCDAAEFACLLN